MAATLGLSAGALVVSGSGPAVASSTKITLDHFLCYKATAKGFKVPSNVQLMNQLQPVKFRPKIGATSALCNPANKQVSAAAGGLTTYLAVHPKSHLQCWAITYPFKPVSQVLINQFGQGAMTVHAPISLCLPSWKSLTGPPTTKLIAPTNLDHFTCYPLTPIVGAYGFRVPAVVKVEDEFSFPKYTTVKVGIGNFLCVPTWKFVGRTVYKPQGANDKSLMCFPVFTTPIRKIVWTKNQFGRGTVYPTAKGEELCLPTVL
jgi:hypothetical protein